VRGVNDTGNAQQTSLLPAPPNIPRVAGGPGNNQAVTLI